MAGRRGALRLSLLLLVAQQSLPPALAAVPETCLALRERRDHLAAQAMHHELVLIRRTRERFCPTLSWQAEAAHAGGDPWATPDYEALIRCRRQAEAQLERQNPVRFRNRLGFTYYTPRGAELARRADQEQQRMQRLGCPRL